MFTSQGTSRQFKSHIKSKALHEIYIYMYDPIKASRYIALKDV